MYRYKGIERSKEHYVLTQKSIRRIIKGAHVGQELALLDRGYGEFCVVRQMLAPQNNMFLTLQYRIFRKIEWEEKGGEREKNKYIDKTHLTCSNSVLNN